MNNSRNRKFRPVRAVVISLLIVFIPVLCFLVSIPPIIAGSMIEGHIDFKTVHSAEEFGLESSLLRLETADGIIVAAYYVESAERKGSVILLSGIHNPSVTALYGHAAMFRDMGYDSYLLEMRAHGESGGDLISLGYKEPLDVAAVTDHIKGDPEVSDKPVIVFGISMGGAVAVNSAGSNPDIDALISLSAYSSFEDNFADVMKSQGAPAFYAAVQKPFVKLYTMRKYGFGTRRMIPEIQIADLGSRPALLIHSKDDDQVPAANLFRIIGNAPPQVSFWLKDGGEHMILGDEAFLDPRKDAEYSKRITDFISANFP